MAENATIPRNPPSESVTEPSVPRVTIVSGLPPVPVDIEPAGAPYLGWGMNVRYFWDMGLVCNPVSAPKGSLTSFVRLHAGSCFKLVTAVAIRLKEKPQIPHPDTQSDNEVLLYRDHVNFFPGEMPGNNEVFGVAVVYLYGLQKMPSMDDMLDSGGSPRSNKPPTLYTINPSDFSQYLSGPASAVSGFSGGRISF